MDEAFFYLSKIIWIFVSPDSLLVFLLISSFLLILFKRQKAANLLIGLITASTLFLSFYSVGDWMLYPLESRYQHNPQLPEKVDGIIILGGSVNPNLSVEWQQLETNLSHERLSSFIQLSQRFPDAKLIFSGGNASMDRNRPTEAQIVENYFLNSGISAERLYIENKARNTAENVTYSKQLTNPDSSETWILITTAFHMPRAMGIFCQQNWAVIPFPVDHQTFPPELYMAKFDLLGHASHLELAMHEWLGLLAYYASGKTNDLFPSECNYSN